MRITRSRWSLGRQPAARLVARVARDFPAEREACPHGSHNALEGAIMTAPDARDQALLEKLSAIAGRVL
jgi:5'-methylthioadenosine phosphorylase